jgi:putative NIF3 family GTP cyclohydrolase 1 type 2
MKLKDLFDSAIQVGIKNDPRGKKLVSDDLKAAKKEYKKLDTKEKKYFDTDSLTNPYADSKMLYGAGSVEVKTALVGIDIEVAEILLAKELKKVDLVIAHHPEGLALANLYKVMGMQSDILAQNGVPISTAQALMDKRSGDVERSLLPTNHSRAVDAARLIDMPMINLHTPADNMVATYLQNLLIKKKPSTLGDIVDMLLEIPEYQQAKKAGAGPKIFVGNTKRKTGKAFVDMTGGTGGSKDIFESISHSGIDTIVGMHIGDAHRKEAEKHSVNVVIAGHISSDNLGINLLLDEIEKSSGKGAKIKYLECSGFRRFSRL